LASTVTIPQPRGQGAPAPQHPRRGLLRELDHPSDVIRPLGPNWFASVMGTGIVANAAAGLPLAVPGLRAAATVVWALAAAWLVVLTAAWVVRWTRYRDEAKADAAHPVMAHFWGAPAMALLTVGEGTLVLGRDWLGQSVALDVDVALWSAGTALGLVVCVWIPYQVMTKQVVAPDAAFGGWLMPVVPPMVSAATGAALIPYAAPGQPRLALLLACYAMFGISLFASVIIITQIWSRLVHDKVDQPPMVPTLWIVLGPLGQSVTAANLLGSAAAFLPRPYAAGAEAFGFLYGVPTWGFAMMWLCLAIALTVRTARRGLPFTLTWWSFTFPVGTCVTGTSALALRLQSTPLDAAAVGLFLLLVTAWITVAIRTARAAASGALFVQAVPAEKAAA
jgi:C4-dicarboxylate transporter/malic acid transport protein